MRYEMTHGLSLHRRRASRLHHFHIHQSQRGMQVSGKSFPGQRHGGTLPAHARWRPDQGRDVRVSGGVQRCVAARPPALLYEKTTPGRAGAHAGTGPAESVNELRDIRRNDKNAAPQRLHVYIHYSPSKNRLTRTEAHVKMHINVNVRVERAAYEVSLR